VLVGVAPELRLDDEGVARRSRRRVFEQEHEVCAVLGGDQVAERRVADTGRGQELGHGRSSAPLR
jgi:hypothetical protein